LDRAELIVLAIQHVQNGAEREPNVAQFGSSPCPVDAGMPSTAAQKIDICTVIGAIDGHSRPAGCHCCSRLLGNATLQQILAHAVAKALAAQVPRSR
jgi:hypothetical protein